MSSSLISGAQGVLVDQVKKYDNVYLLKSLKREVGIKTIFFEFAAFFQMIYRMRKLKKKFPNIIVHTHSTKAGLMGRWAAFFARIKKRIHTVHGFGFHDHQSKIGWIINFVLEFLTSFITTHYVCVSMNDRKIGKKLIPRFWNKSSIIRAAVDWDKFSPAKTINKPNKFIFGTVSCLKPQKNIIDLLKAFKFMYDSLSKENKDKIILQIVGDGIERPKIENWIDKNKFAGKIDLLGWQSDVSKFMRSWDVFVMSSLWEGLPCAIVEARLSKLPVVSYKIAGIPEVIKNNQNGFLVEPGDWKLLGKKMQTLVQDRKLCKKLSNHEQDLTDFKNATMVNKHINLYKSL